MIQKVKVQLNIEDTQVLILYHIRGRIIERLKYTVYMLACAKFAYYTDDNYIVKGIISQYICSEKYFLQACSRVMVRVHVNAGMAEQSTSSLTQGRAQLLCWTVEKQSLSV